jgi:hypothetical protein
MCGSATLAIVVSNACMMVVNMTDMVTKPRCEPSEFAAGMAAAIMVVSSEREPEHATAMTGIDFHDSTETRAQLRHSVRDRELNPYRHPLHDLDPVAGGILSRDDRELRARRRTQTVHGTLPGEVGIGIDMDRDPAGLDERK